MSYHSQITTNQHRVSARFWDHEQSFDLVSGTTLAQLAERLAELAQQNHGWPVGISVVFDVPSERLRETDIGAPQTHHMQPLTGRPR